MAIVISISGPSSTGKTSLQYSLMTHPLFCNNKYKFPGNIHDAVWDELVSKKLFTEFSEIYKDQDYLCVYICKLIKAYEDMMDSFNTFDGVVILDGCWLDLAIYALVNMYYMPGIKEVQEDILKRLLKFKDDISAIYITQYDESKETKDNSKLPKSKARMSNKKMNRNLELQYYELFSNLNNAEQLPKELEESQIVDYITDQVQMIYDLWR